MPGDECDTYLCNECPNSFSTLEDLEKHMNSVHVSYASASSVKTESWEEEMNQDIKVEDMNDDHIISQLPNGNSPTSSDATHEDSLMIDDHSEIDEMETSNGKFYKCRFCDKIFEDRSQLNVHYTHTHRDKPQYECDQCGVVFAIKRELSTHQRIHSGETPHKCGQCGKEFGTRQLLKKHNMWHTGERTHVCQHCGKAFFQKGHLTQHLMIHKGGRPHRCNQCDKTFIFKFDLNRHMKIHLERGHSCNKCGKSFLKQISLDEHMLKCKRSPPSTHGFRTPQSNDTRNSTPLSDISRNEINPSPRRISGIHLPTPLHPKVSTQNPLMLSQNLQLPNGFSNEDMAKLAQTLVAQHQQRLLAAAAQNLNNGNFFNGQQNGANRHAHGASGLSAAQAAQAAQLLFGQQNQMATSLAQQQQSVIQAQTMVQNGQNQLFCMLCNKQYANQAAYALHWSVVHFRNGLVGQPQQVKMEENELNVQNLQSTLFQQQLKREDSLNLHSDTATSSSCASSPQKISPIATNHSPQAHSETDHSPLTEASVTPDESKMELKAADSFCEHCEVQRQKNMELEKQLAQVQDELERMKDMMRNFGNIAGSILKPLCTDDKLWMLHKQM